MGHPTPKQQEMQRVVICARRYLESRLNGTPVSILNGLVREMRVQLHKVLTEHFLALTLEKAREFRVALHDHLSSLMGEMNGHRKCSQQDIDHHSYCTQEILACFIWAEQIKAEVPEDLVTQRVLAVDIPILRPFDYGRKGHKSIKPHKK